MSKKKIRDPKINPIAGDVVEKLAGRKKLRRVVESASGGSVAFRHRGLLFYATLESWRRWCNVECNVVVWGDAPLATGPRGGAA